MPPKNTSDKFGFVFSTNPDFKFIQEEQTATPDLKPSQQKLQLKLDTKQRAGKVVTLVNGFIGKEEDVAILAKKLKTLCGTGGSVKDNTIIIQGDQRDKLFSWLIKNEYKNTKKI